MTPLELSILIHYYCHVEDYRFGDFSATAVRGAIDWFKGSAGMLEPSNRNDYPDAIYKLTDKGIFFVEQLCNVPLPVRSWTMPSIIPHANPPA